jgi:hypothetical protein
MIRSHPRPSHVHHGSLIVASRLLENSEVAEDVPQDDEDDDGAETAAA